MDIEVLHRPSYSLSSVIRAHAKHVRNGVETLRVPTFEQNQEILQSTLTTFACAQTGSVH